MKIGCGMVKVLNDLGKDPCGVDSWEGRSLSVFCPVSCGCKLGLGSLCPLACAGEDHTLGLVEPNLASHLACGSTLDTEKQECNIVDVAVLTVGRNCCAGLLGLPISFCWVVPSHPLPNRVFVAWRAVRMP